MLPSDKAYSSFAAKDIQAEKRFFGETLGMECEEMFGGELLDLRLGSDKHHVLIYKKDDFAPAAYTVLNFPVRDVDAAVDDLTRSGVEMARFDGFGQDEKGIARGGEGPTIAWFRDPAGNIMAVHSDEQM